MIQILEPIPITILESCVLLAMEPDGILTYENAIISSFLPETISEIFNACKRTLRTGEPESLEIFSELERKTYSCRTISVKETNLNTKAAFVTFHDVTERKKQQEFLKIREKSLLDAQEIAHIGTWEWDVALQKLSWSDEVYRIYGENKKTFIVSYENYAKKIHPEDFKKVKGAIVNAIENKQGYDLDERVLRPDGSVRYLHTWCQPVTDDSGHLIKLLGVCQDVTDFKLSEISLEQTLSLLRATIESTADGILVVDLEGKIVTFNQKFGELWKIPQSVLSLRKDNRALDFVLSQIKYPEKFIAKIQELYSEPTAESFETLEFKDERVFERYSKPQMINNKPVGRVWSFRDVTARVQAEKAAMAASIAKTQFLANISHEIRTPLTAVLGFSDLLADSTLSQEDRLDLVSRVQAQGANLLRIVDDILEISKAELGHFQINISDVNIIDLIHELKQIFLLKIRGKNIQLIFTIEGAIPLQIKSDPTRLKQILMNLIGNAIKFTSAGSVEVELKFISSDKRKSQLSFKIRDTGIGMNMNEAQKIFEPFMQIDSSLTRNYGGTGLGLALSKELAVALGGTIRLLQSTLGTGSTFEAVVKTGDVSRTTFISDFNFNENLRPNIKNDENNSKLEGIKVLLVEDSIDNQFIVSQYLKKAGASLIDYANNGKEGVDKALSGNFDIVFMDLQMPIMNGYEATKELRLKGYRKPIVALTAHAMDGEIKQSMTAGCNFHLCKPIDRNKIIETTYRFTHEIESSK